MTHTGWGSSELVASWMQGVEVRNRALAPATARMFAEAGVGAGFRVLDVGTGTGDTALLAAERVGPSGSVVAIDASPAMIEAALAALSARGSANVTARVMAADALEFPFGSFDAVVTRNVLMFVDLPATLAEIHRVLRPGGRIAAVVWSTLTNNPYHRLILDAVRARGGWGEPVPELARAFALGDADTYRKALTEAGFRQVAAHPVASARSYPSARDALEAMRSAPMQSEPIARLPQELQAAAWAEIEAGLLELERGGTCDVPLESLVLVGSK